MDLEAIQPLQPVPEDGLEVEDMYSRSETEESRKVVAEKKGGAKKKAVTLYILYTRMDFFRLEIFESNVLEKQTGN